MKANSIVLAARYAKAYDALSPDAKSARAALEAYRAALLGLKAAQSYIENPSLPLKVKEELLSKILKKSAASSFIRLLVGAKRFYLAPLIEEHLQSLLDARLGLKRVSIKYALPPSPGEKKTIESALQKYFNSALSASYEEDSSLLSGLVIRQGDTVIDGSAAGRLKQLSKILTENG